MGPKDYTHKEFVEFLQEHYGLNVDITEDTVTVKKPVDGVVCDGRVLDPAWATPVGGKVMTLKHAVCDVRAHGGFHKIACIKILRQHFKMELKEAKDFIEMHQPRLKKVWERPAHIKKWESKLDAS